MQKVAVGVGDLVGVFVGRFGVGVLVFVGGKGVGVLVYVGVGTVAVGVRVLVRVGEGTVAVGVRVMVGVFVIVGVRVMVGVRVGVRVGLGVFVGTLVGTTALMGIVQVPVPPKSKVRLTPYEPLKFLLLKSANQSVAFRPARLIAGEAVLFTGEVQLFAVA